MRMQADVRIQLRGMHLQYKLLAGSPCEAPSFRFPIRYQALHKGELDRRSDGPGQCPCQLVNQLLL